MVNRGGAHGFVKAWFRDPTRARGGRRSGNGLRVGVARRRSLRGRNTARRQAIDLSIGIAQLRSRRGQIFLACRDFRFERRDFIRAALTILAQLRELGFETLDLFILFPKHSLLFSQDRRHIASFAVATDEINTEGKN